MNAQRFWKRPGALLMAAAAGVALGGYGVAHAGRLMGANPPASLRLADANEAPIHSGFALVVRRVLPSVVNISSSKTVHAPAGLSGHGPMDQLFQQFFGGGEAPRPEREQSLGSGVVVSPEGYILTNNHVVNGATDIRVTLSDKRQFKARVIGTDPKTDVAVLKIDATGLRPIVIGDSSQVEVGDYALAIGDPFGVGQTVTMGIVSATRRSNLGIEDYEDFIQTDAPINPGNSGGALVNQRGELIGINTAIIAHGSDGNQGIGFAVPSDLARQVMTDILKDGKVIRAYLGIMPQDVTPAIAKAFGEKEPRGALVGDVTPGSPAQKSGLQKGDIVLEVNGKPVSDSNALRMNISMMRPDTTVNMKIWRNQAEQNLTVQLAALPGSEEHAANSKDKSGDSLDGVSVENLDADAANQLGLPPSASGVVVTDIDPASQAADSGLQPGDVIQQVNRQPVRNVHEFEHALRASKDQETLLLVNRRGTTMFLTV
ncbi:MAG: DegQ family serine endoprotease [Acidobacteria bacterium]|nr:DegQ family serine endoprotease [Acidobacteriota bacterium]